MATNKELERDLKDVKDQVGQLTGNVLNNLVSKTITVVGIRNTVPGDKYFHTVDGKERILRGAGKAGDTMIIDSVTWSWMRDNDDSVSMGYTVRDDSILRSDDIIAEPDSYISPNVVLNDDLKQFADMSIEDFKNRIADIDNPEILTKIQSYFQDLNEQPIAHLAAVEQAWNILNYDLPSNFYQMSKKELYVLAKEIEYTEIPKDIKSASMIRNELLSFLKGVGVD